MREKRVQKQTMDTLVSDAKRCHPLQFTSWSIISRDDSCLGLEELCR